MSHHNKGSDGKMELSTVCRHCTSSCAVRNQSVLITFSIPYQYFTASMAPNWSPFFFFFFYLK